MRKNCKLWWMLVGVILFTIHYSLFTSCARQEYKNYTNDVLNRMTPIKDQGDSPTCWIYAMLAAIETEHLAWGDSVNLSPYYIENMMEREPNLPEDKRGMGATLLQLIQKYGIVGYDAMRSVEIPAPKYAFMAGAEYTTQEFARSVCKPGEYINLTANEEEPYYQMVDIVLPDNWLNDRFYNVPIDTLLKKTERAVRQHHGVCWEDEEHAMAIVGIAHDDGGHRYFIMKNSWGTDGPYGGLEYISYKNFRRNTVAVEMTKEAYGLP